ncbi:PadR family transcriptional regulator [Flavobacterium sp. T12S277]|uniref:PadR family transcriptional regulator n=1 Tax=Flavobacterium sp. T12S277 TaxID=3402752 RepID=UPI003ADE6541
MTNEFIDKWQLQVKKGTLSFIVLLVLNEKKLYGYELIDKIKKLTDIEIAEGTLYPLMNRLSTEGLLNSEWVEQETGIPRKYYVITYLGKETLEEMKKHWNDLQILLNNLM